MAEIVVVGGGFAGMSVAARLAKLRHRVTLLEQASALGGRLLPDPAGPWYLHCPTVTLPGVLRDLFRKSGRPLERALNLEGGSLRHHVWPDGSALGLEMGNRGVQHDAVARSLGADSAQEWSLWVDQWAAAWDSVRRVALDRLISGPHDFNRQQRRQLRMHRNLRRIVRRGPIDEHLSSLISVDAQLDGHDLRRVPGLWALQHYVERTFGRWSVEGGPEALATALITRLAERKVQVSCSVNATDIRTRNGAVFGVDTDTGAVDAEIVLWCAGSLPASMPVSKRLPMTPSTRTLIRLTHPKPSLPADITVHCAPPVRLWSVDNQHWTVVHRSGQDPLAALARTGIDLRNSIDQQHRRSPSELIQQAHFGWHVHSPRDAFSDLRHSAGNHAMWMAGAHASLTPDIETIGMHTAAIADQIGAVPR